MSNKFLNCESAGTIAIPLKQSHGCWEFDVYKGADVNQPYFNIITDRVNPFLPVYQEGYQLALTSNESLLLRQVNNTAVPVNLLQTAASYISNNTWYRIKVARLQSEGVFKDIPTLQTSLIDGTSYPYESFTNNSKYGFSALTTSTGVFLISTSAINININAKYLIEFDLKLNSGTTPTIEFRNGQTGSSQSNSVVPVNGRNSIILTSTATSSSVLRFFNTTATNYEISGLTIRRIYPSDTFAVFIKGGSFGYEWTLIDTTGGGGTNPVTDATYTTSEYFVADLDAGDRLANLKITNGVKQ